MPLSKLPEGRVIPAAEASRTRTVVLIGGANMDITAQAAVAPIAGDSTRGTIRWAPGGVARNVAENLARLGLAPWLVSVVGDDHFGALLRDATRQSGVDVSAVQTMAGFRTATYVSMHGPDGDAASAVNDMAILDALAPDGVVGMLDTIRTAACVVVDCNLSIELIRWVLTQDGLGPIFVDGVSVAKCQRILGLFDCIHTLKVNRVEAQALTGIVVGTVDDACLAAVQLHQRGVRQVVVSLGALGVCWCDEHGQTGHQPARQQTIVNTSGAGDALLAGLVHARLSGLTLAQAIDFAMVCAAITLESPHANAPALSLTAVQSALSGQRVRHP